MLTAFTAGLLLITLSELGDKTFCIAMLLAMRQSRRWVFVGVATALATMTVLSVALGQVVSLLPRSLMHGLEIFLFIGFGLKLLYDASKMPAASSCDEMQEAEEVVAQAKTTRKRQRIVLQAFVLTFVGEWGDRTQFATIALAASYNPWGVMVGATLGHMICAAIAVLGGRLVAGRISERVITALGGVLFLVFGVSSWLTGA